MFKWLVNRRLKKFEREFDYSMDYVREILAATTRGFLAFSKALSLAKYREGAPREATYAASIAATLAEDCGRCTQLVVTMAEHEDVSPATGRGCRRMRCSAIVSPKLCWRAILRRRTVCALKLSRNGAEERLSRWR